eukprot:scaffold15488_cov62-Phaeocystis_antarctica.AAC.2
MASACVGTATAVSFVRGVRTTTGPATRTNTTSMVHGTWYRANSGQANVQAPSHAVPHAARWRRPRHALRPQHAARSSARLPKHGAVRVKRSTGVHYKVELAKIGASLLPIRARIKAFCDMAPIGAEKAGGGSLGAQRRKILGLFAPIFVGFRLLVSGETSARSAGKFWAPHAQKRPNSRSLQTAIRQLCGPAVAVREHKGSHQLDLGVARHVHAAQRLLLCLGRRREGLDPAPRLFDAAAVGVEHDDGAAGSIGREEAVQHARHVPRVLDLEDHVGRHDDVEAHDGAHALRHAVEHGVRGGELQRLHVPVADHHLGRAGHRARNARRARARTDLQHPLAAHVHVVAARAGRARHARGAPDLTAVAVPVARHARLLDEAQ